MIVCACVCVCVCNIRYDPLCQSLKENEERKKSLIEVLESCMKEEKKIMGETKGIVEARMMDDSRLLRSMATKELEMQRGYQMGPESTYHMPAIGGASGEGSRRFRGADTTAQPKGSVKLPRNLNSTV